MGEYFRRDKNYPSEGISFPFKLNDNGQMVMNCMEEHIRQSILLILQTSKGERVMRSDFGSNLHDLIYSDMSVTTATLIKHEVEDALIRFEPRIDLINVDVTVEPGSLGVLIVKVEYKIKKNGKTFDLLFPFYLEGGDA